MIAIGGLALVLVLTSAAPAQKASGTEAELTRMTGELLAAVASGDWAVWDKYLDDSMLYTSEDGRTLTKAQLKDEIKPLPPGFSGTIEVESAEVHLYGDAAVVSHEDLERENVFDQKLVSHYHSTDTWIRKAGRWRLVASQVLVRLQDPAPASIVDKRAYADYVGRYDLSPSVSFTVRREGDRLFGQRNGRAEQELLPETDTVFFTVGAPRTRKIFVRDATGKVARIIDRRDGRDLVWTRAGTP
ncbi:MAG TPA: DUF4440 domain-containing protein [Thermoanaerobaculia bacterium]|jgi:hypothetical protein